MNHIILGRRDSTAACALIFSLPVLGLFKVNLVGDLFLSEPVILFFAAKYLVELRIKSVNKLTGRILFLCVMWLLAQIITDIYVSTPFDDRLRGTAKIFIFMLNIFVLDKLLINQERIWFFLLGYAVTFFVRPFIDFGDQNEVTDSSGFNLMWKFGFGFGVFILLLLCCLPLHVLRGDCRYYAKNLAKAAFFVGIMSFFFNARSLAGILMVTAYLLYVFSMPASSFFRQNIFITLFGLFVAVQVVSFVYSWGASSGKFGQEAMMKYNDQYGPAGSKNNILDILGGGRSEFLVSTQAIKDSPWLGHGSWAKNYSYTILYMELRREKMNNDEFGGDVESLGGLIPSHSHLLGAWVEGGIIGALFWFVLIFLIIFFVLPRSLLRGDFVGVVAISFLPMGLWNIFFSPFGGHVKLSTAYLIVVFLGSMSEFFKE